MLSITCAVASAQVRLPEMGVVSSKALTISKEISYGDFLLERLYQNKSVIDDPLLTNYLRDLGQRLVNHTHDIKFPVRFVLVQDSEINASAFLGGVIAVNTGLFEYAQSEDELAAVLAHEISHVAQRHLARFIEAEAQKKPLTIAGYITSIGLALIDPKLGAAALGTTIGIHQNAAIHFTRENEYEADRIGIQTLHRAGFDPHAMAQFFQQLAVKYRHVDQVPQMLLTHPVPETRIAEARNRARVYSEVRSTPQLNFQLAKARIIAMYADRSHRYLQDFFQKHSKTHIISQQKGAQYGAIITDYMHGNAKRAQKELHILLEKEPGNLFYIDVMTDIDIKFKYFKRAQLRLKKQQKMMSNHPVLVLNLANVYLAKGEYSSAQIYLDEYINHFPKSRIAWSLLTQVYYKQRDDLRYHQSKAQLLLIEGRRGQAIASLKQARKYAKTRLVSERIDAQIEQIEKEHHSVTKQFS